MKKKKILYFLSVLKTFNLRQPMLYPTYSDLFRPIGTYSGLPPPHPYLFDVPCSAFNVQIPSCPHPYQLGRKRIVYFLLSLLPLFPPVQVQINPNQPRHDKKQAKSKPKQTKNESTAAMSSDLVTTFAPAHLDSL
jgi:hypothetical protein